ncbi:helix-turn-helix transcriptional regulator [Hydrogenophaga sp.]|uniref:helix-turn-helix transcriptional regulator n=1 Tax=Hydrogenophaga sp. TaxID=1904254 RepID=UPI00351E58F7
MEVPNRSGATPQRALYTYAEVAHICGFSRSQLFALVRRQKFPAPAVRLGTRFTRWSSADVDEWARDPQGWIDRNAPTTEGAA